MIKDYFISGIVVGLIADLVKLAVNLMGYIANYTPVVFWQITAARFLEKPFLFKPLAYLIGGIADITVSAFLGIIFVYFIYIFGSKHLTIKGIGFGLAVWVGLFGTLLGQSVEGKLTQTPASILVTIIAHLFFGLTLALLTQRLQLTSAPENKKLRRFNFMPSPALKIEHVHDEKHLKKPIEIENIKHW